MTQANGKENAIFGRGRTITIPDIGILFDWGITVPTDGAEGYAPGCLFQDVDGSADANFYINQGTKASSNFDPIDIGTILASNVPILDTAGWFSSTNTETVLAELGELLLANAGSAAGAGPSPLIWDKAPILETILDPTVGVYYFNDYMGEIDVTTADGYVITAVTTGAIAPVIDEDGGVLLIDSAGNATADDGVNVQLTNCMVKPVAGRTIRFEARVKVVDAGDDQYFIGLAGVDTTLIAAGVLDNVVDKCGFFRFAASTADRLSTINSRGSGGTVDADVSTVVDDTYVKLGFVIDGLTSITFYQNGVQVGSTTVTSEIPNAVMCLSYVSQVEQTSADAELSVDWVRIHQEGARTA